VCVCAWVWSVELRNRRLQLWAALAEWLFDAQQVCTSHEFQHHIGIGKLECSLQNLHKMEKNELQNKTF
jgi:hypothetical protein